MKKLSHKSADASHYNHQAEHYDWFNEKNSELINETIEKIVNKNKVKSILDFTCGTGSQVFWLAKRGYDVSGYDINSKMLKIAKDKAKKQKLEMPFSKGDMRTTKTGQFDAVITIFNAIGHLTKTDFEQAIYNIRQNLNNGGLYIFDIFNLNYLLNGNNITKLTIDWQKKSGDTTVREIQYSTIDIDGVLASYDIYYEQKGSTKPKISNTSQTLQVYNSKQLKEMLHKYGFTILRQCGVDGSRFSDKNTERILTIAIV